jgi:hypothetical protein
VKKATQASALAVCAGTRAEVEHDGEFVIVDVEASAASRERTPTPCSTFYGSDATPHTG